MVLIDMIVIATIPVQVTFLLLVSEERIKHTFRVKI